MELSGGHLGRSDRGSRSRPGEEGSYRQLGQELLGRCTPLFGGRRLCEFHDGRGPGARQSELSGQLRAPGGHQAHVRSREFLSRESEHQAFSRAARIVSRCPLSCSPTTWGIYAATVPSHSGQGCCRVSPSSPTSRITWTSSCLACSSYFNCSVRQRRSLASIYSGYQSSSSSF